MLTTLTASHPATDTDRLETAPDLSWDALLAELFAAVREDDVAEARTLIAVGAPVRARNRHGQCALACAAVHAGPDLVALLLDAGANPNGLGVNDHPVLTLAAGREMPEVVRLLLDAGANPDSRRRLTGETALHVAATCGCLEVSRALLAAGADPRLRAEAEVETDLFPGGRWVAEETALHRAAESAPRPLIEALLAAGASPAARTMLGETPQSWARRARRSRDIIALLRYGAAVSLTLPHRPGRR
jgi:ankyrin repeat protein